MQGAVIDPKTFPVGHGDVSDRRGDDSAIAVIGIVFGDQDMGEQGGGCEALGDWTFRGRRLMVPQARQP
jgi:hypothetical protein